MKVCKLDLDIEDPKLAQIIIDGLKLITSRCCKEISEISDQYRWSGSETMPSKDAQRINEISCVPIELTKQIESCENGSKLIED